MECEINNQGFFIPKSLLTTELIAKIKADLNVSPFSDFNEYNVKTFKVYKVLSGIGIIIPIYYALSIITDFNLTYKVNFSKVKNEFTDNYNTNVITLRPGTQEECFNVSAAEFDKPFGGGILNLQTAVGKSVLALKLICHSKMKALIIVNTIELMVQWKSEIKKFIPDARIGTIQGKTFDIEDKDIVIGMVQTITIKDEVTFHNFYFANLLILDEIHNFSSEVFSKIIFKIRPKVIFGLTATLARKDKLEKLLHWYAGPVLFSNISKEKKDETEIHIYKYKGPSSITVTLRDNKTPACSTMISNIADDTARSNLIVSILKDLTKNKDRNVLVISDRISQLQYLHKHLVNSALFIGKMKSDELLKSKESQILLATYKLASEGFSLAKLNCLLFATSRTSITQAIGRIYRKKHEITPIIVDIYDDFSYFKSQYYKRRKTYKELISNCIFKNYSNSKQATVTLELPQVKNNETLDFEVDSD